MRIQISQTPGKGIALAGVVLALLGLLGSLFIRPRRVWVRARREGVAPWWRWPRSTAPAAVRLTEVLARIVAALRGPSREPDRATDRRRVDDQRRSGRP